MLLGACSATDLFLTEVALDIATGAGNPPSDDRSVPEKLFVSAGPDQIVTEGELVNLTSSADPSIDSEDLVYEWKKTIGPKITLDTSERGTASFVAPPAKKIRTLTIRLKARAENGNVYEDSVVVVVKPASLSDSLQ